MKYLFLFFFLSIPLRAIIIPFDFSGPSANNVDTNPATSVFLTVTSTGIIEDLNLVMEIQAGHTEDFDIFLTSPLGTKVQVREQSPSSHMDFFNLTFDDESSVPHSSLSTNNGLGSFQPFQPLSAFDGEVLFGIWKLQILDDFVPNENNTLFSWRITGEVVPEPGSIFFMGTASSRSSVYVTQK